MTEEKRKLKKLIKYLSETRLDFYNNPASYFLEISKLLKNLSPILSIKAAGMAEKEGLTTDQLDQFLAEINLILIPEKKYKDESSNPAKNKVGGLKRLGAKSMEKLEKFGLNTYEDILLHFPFRYDSLSSVIEGEKGVLTGTLQESGMIYTKNRKRLYKAVFSYEGGQFSATWFHFNNRFPSSALKNGKKYSLFGRINNSGGLLNITHPEFLDIDDVGELRAVYSLPGGIQQKTYAAAVDNVIEMYLDYLPDLMPVRLMDKYNFPEIKDAVRTLHRPKPDENHKALADRTHPAYKRFVYEELFYTQLGLLLKKRAYSKEKGIKFEIKEEYLNDIKDLLPFKLTSAQKKSLADIFNDMKSEDQMNRLVQGDVGSGKTIVAFIAGLIAVKNGFQVAIIAPTEVLAEQHYNGLIKLIDKTHLTAALLTGSIKGKEKQQSKDLIAAGAVDIVIGTHAVIQDEVSFSKLGLAIIDEQHRFGVMQRKQLMDKGYNPDIILMTATPIPRTLSLTFYGDLDISIIDEMPPGRVPIITRSFPDSGRKRVLDLIHKELDKGNKAYFIYPLIEASEKIDLKAVTDGHKSLSKIFGEDNVGLMHGKLKAQEKNELMNEFKNGDIKILVSTTVIEVGVDVPDATVIVIENSERFGLSQLHQLRGRVGRSDKQSYCVLLHENEISDDGRNRIEAMVNHTSGFKLSEIDLEMRGPGDFFGTRQAGLPEFRFSNIVRDIEVLIKARQDAEDMLKRDPDLENSSNKVIRETVINKWRHGLEIIEVG